MIKKYSGFTLLELLIVIGLIGILVAMSVTSYSTIQKKSRDSRRMSDMKAIQNACEQYYADFSGFYPALEADVTTNTYLPGGMPTDPKNATPYLYTKTFTADGYCVCALLETGNGNADNSNCDFASTNAKTYFCVKNLQ